jgi:class 3 adenylate cyclase/pimeloyl-ACP methyl ester carboxylesterase
VTALITRYATAADGTQLAYATTGSGPALLAVPPIAATLSGRRWDVIAETLGAEVTTYDRRGSGQSTRGAEITIDLLIDDMVALLDSIGHERITLWGQLLAVFETLGFASRYPDRVERVVLWDPYPNGEAWRAVRSVDGWVTALRGDWEWWSEAWGQFLVGWGNPGGPTLAARVRRDFDPAGLRALVELYSRADAMEFASGVSAPTLVIQGLDELSFSRAEFAQTLARSIAGAQLVAEQSSPHPQGEGPPAFDADMAGRGVASLRALSGRTLEAVREFIGSEPRAAGGSPSTFSTILFTDVVSSTPLLSQLRDERMRAVMRDHDAICGAAITQHGGRVVKTIGDAFMAEFSVPSAAIDAAIAIQRGIRETFENSDVPIRLRIGINAGEPIVEDDDLHGASVVIAKRLESEADSDGILVSDVVRQAVAGKDFEFEDRGEVELKGFDQPVRAWAVRW